MFKIVSLRKRVKIIGILLVVALSSCADFQDKKILYFAHSLPTSHPVHMGILDMQEVFRRKNQGANFRLKYFLTGNWALSAKCLNFYRSAALPLPR